MLFDDGIPPVTWPRILAVDVGGATPWGWLWCAIDPHGNIVWYNEIYETTTNAQRLVDKAMPYMTYEDTEFKWIAKVIDYENKIAAEDLRKGGIQMTNARKHDKASSLERLKGYLHPNPKHHFPEWHSRAGQPGSPRAFVLASCKEFRREIPQARWLEQAGVVKNEMDRKTGNHLVDCALYTIRELPPPLELPPTPAFVPHSSGISKRSECYWFDLKVAEERRQRLSRTKGRQLTY